MAHNEELNLADSTSWIPLHDTFVLAVWPPIIVFGKVIKKNIVKVIYKVGVQDVTQLLKTLNKGFEFWTSKPEERKYFTSALSEEKFIFLNCNVSGAHFDTEICAKYGPPERDLVTHYSMKTATQYYTYMQAHRTLMPLMIVGCYNSAIIRSFEPLMDMCNGKNVSEVDFFLRYGDFEKCIRKEFPCISEQDITRLGCVISSNATFVAAIQSLWLIEFPSEKVHLTDSTDEDFN